MSFTYNRAWCYWWASLLVAVLFFNFLFSPLLVMSSPGAMNPPRFEHDNVVTTTPEPMISPFELALRKKSIIHWGFMGYQVVTGLCLAVSLAWMVLFWMAIQLWMRPYLAEGSAAAIALSNLPADTVLSRFLSNSHFFYLFCHGVVQGALAYQLYRGLERYALPEPSLLWFGLVVLVYPPIACACLWRKVLRDLVDLLVTTGDMADTIY